MSEIAEKTFCSEREVLVTDKRVVLWNKTWALKQITSVANVEIKNGPKRLFGFNVGKVMCCCAIGWLAFAVIKISIQNITIVAALGLASYLCLIAAVLLSVLWVFCPRDKTHWVEIGSASGKENALLCHSQHQAQKISDAINEAIINN